MPVGCLGVSGSAADSTLYLSQEASQQAERIELMQSRLLIQIFRVGEGQETREEEESLTCQVCSPHTKVCCQAVSGWQVMTDLVRANTEAVWNLPLVKAVNTLSYQGYLCPGYLVTMTDRESVRVLEENWRAHSLISPPQYKIITAGLSQGCSLAPFLQSPSPSLQDAICVILSRLKICNTVANMENIIARLKQDYSQIPAPRDFVHLVHKTLGALIKARKVYYTGKGYFLVQPEVEATWQEQHRLIISGLGVGGGVGGGGAETSTQTEVSRASPVRVGENGNNTSLASSEGSQNSSHLERSQSFKLSKKVQKTLSKGGSLRLSKKESVTFKEDNDNSKNEEAEEELENESPEPMKRKNSVLGRIFGRKKSSGSPKKEVLTFSAQFPPPDLLENLKQVQRQQGSGRLTTTTETTQTPTQTPTQKRSLPSRPPLPSPATAVSPVSPSGVRSEVRNGPSGNYVVFERSSNGSSGQEVRPPNLEVRSPNLSQRPLPQSPAQETYGHTGHIYSQPSLYGHSKPPPPAYVSPPYRAAPVSPSKLRAGPAQLQKQVHFAVTPRAGERESPLSRSSPSYRSPSSDGSSSVSGPSSIDSVLYDESLVVIEKSNKELEQRLGRRTPVAHKRVDTIHNNRLLDQEIIFEESNSDILSRSSSASTLKPDNQQDQAILPDHPSLADLGSIADLSAKFQSLTARKLMAGLSISSIDTLLEVNAASDHNNKLSILNESTETIDFGVI